MTRPAASRLAVAVATIVLSIAACNAGPPGSPGPSVPTSSAAGSVAAPTPVSTPAGSSGAAFASQQAASSSKGPAYRLVILGDSMFNSVGDTAGPLIAARLGVAVSVQSWINPDLAKYEVGGERASDLVARVRTDAALRADLRAADAIWFDVPLGSLFDICASPSSPRTALAACFPKAVSQYMKDADALMQEIIALRPPSQAAIRVLTVWQFFAATFRDGGTSDLAVPAWQQMAAAVRKAAASHLIGVVDGYAVFSGPDGSRDPVATGDVLSDEVHLTGKGVAHLVDLFIASGLQPSP